MSLINSSNDMTPFDLRERPVRQFLPISMLLWTVSYISTGGPKMKIRKIVRGKMILPPHGKEFFHAAVSRFLHNTVSKILHGCNLTPASGE